MRKGIKVVRTHVALSACLLLLTVLAVTGGGVYAVFAGNTGLTGVGEAVSTADMDEEIATETSTALVTPQLFRDAAAANGMPTPETARAEALAMPPAGNAAVTDQETLVTADTPRVMPVHLPASAMNVRQLERLFPGLHLSAQAQAQVQGRLDELSNVTVGITTAAVDLGAEGATGGVGKSLSVEKSTGEGEGESPPDFGGLDLEDDFDACLAMLNISYPQIDYNGYGVGSLGGVQLGFGNGIPDRAEMLLVEQVLKTDSIDFSEDGVEHGAAVARWQAILAAFNAEEPLYSLTEEEQASVMRVIAAYCMLGDPASVQLALAVGGLTGWMPVSDAAQRSLMAPQPCPFSALGNFTGQTGYCNSAKWIIAQEKAAAAANPGTPTFENIVAVWLAMLDTANTTAQSTSTQFCGITMQMTGQFLSPTLGRLDLPAGSDATLVALADAPWLFDHWEVTPATGSPYTATNQALAIEDLGCNMTVCAVGEHDPDAQIGFSFTDARLEQAVRVAAVKLNGDLLWGDVEGITLLEAPGMGITSLEGLQYLTALDYLDLRNNQITDITPLGGLINMRCLILGHNQISDISPLAGMADLIQLDLGWSFQSVLLEEWIRRGGGNRISNIAPLSSLSSLLALDLVGNTITRCDALSAMPSLLGLLLDGNAGLLAADSAEPAGDAMQNCAALGTLGNLAILDAQNTGLTDTALQQMLIDPEATGTAARRMPELWGISLGGNPELTTLAPLADYDGLVCVICVNSPGLHDIGAITGKTGLTGVALVNTAVANLSAPDCASFDTGLLLLRNNALLGGDSGFTRCERVARIEARGVTVDRDFACDGQKLLTITVSPAPPNAEAGSVVPFVGSRPFATNASVAIRAVQTNPAYTFSHWTGAAADPTNPETAVYMNADRAVTAVFAAGGAYTLEMLPPEGVGTVEPAPGRWACRSGEQRTIKAVPAPGSVFKWWADDQETELSSSRVYILTMNGNLAVKAVFAPADVELRLDAYGEGSVCSYSDGAVLSENYHAARFYYNWGDWTVLAAKPGPNACFTEWWGDCTDPFSDPALAFVYFNPSVYGNQPYLEVAAIFNYCEKAELAVGVEGFGVTTPAPGTHRYTPGSAVPLTANPYPGWRFDHWTEDGQDDQPRDPYTVTIAQSSTPRVIMAHFVEHDVLNDFQEWLNAVYDAPRPPIGTYHLGEDFETDQHDQTDTGRDMPDLVRFAMLDAGLKNPVHPRHADLTRVFWNNVVWWYAFAASVAENDTTGTFVFPSAAELHTYAAYSIMSCASGTATTGTMFDLAVQMFKIAHSLPSLTIPSGLPAREVCFGGLALDGDFDGDGFTNIDEWFYSLWKNGDVTGSILVWDPDSNLLSYAFRELVWGRLTDNAKVPDFGGTARTDVPPTVQVTISKQGEGHVYPSVGTYLLSKYKLSSWWQRDNSGNLIARPESSMTAADYASLTVTAAATGDWSFRCWRGGVAEISGSLPQALQTQLLQAGGEDPNAAKALPLGADWQLTGVFKYRPGMQRMDLLADVAAFVAAAGEASQADFLGLSYDTGRLAFDENGNWLYAANSIPDAAEVALLEAVLQDPDLELASRGGVSHEYVWRAYAGNLDLARGQMPAQGASVHRAVASLLTIGDLGHAFHAVDLVKKAFNVDLSLDGQKTGAQRWLGAKGDANADGVSNLDAWNAAASGGGAAEDAAGDFVALAVADAQGETAFSMPSGTQMCQMATQSAAENDCGCWNDECAEPQLLKVVPAPSVAGTIGVTGSIESPEECSTVNPGLPLGALVQTGRKVKVSASGAGFTMWDAPGTPIDGSNNPKETFVHGISATVAPAASDTSITIYYYPPYEEVCAAPDGGVSLQRTDHPAWGYTTFVGTCLSKVTLSATGGYTVSGVFNGEPFSLNYELVGWKLSTGSSVDNLPTVGTTSPTVLMGIVQTAQPVYQVSGGSHTGMEPITLEHNPTSADGGVLMANLNLGEIKTEFWLPEGGAFPSQTVSYLAWPHPGYMWRDVEMDGQMGGRAGTSGTVNKSTTGCADFVQLARLTVNIESEGTDPSGAKPECMGSYTLSPAYYYYTPDLPAEGPLTAIYGQEVTVTANARPGYRFVQWVGSGVATYKLLGFIDISARLDQKDNPITSDTITVTMHSDRELTAVFAKPYPIGFTATTNTPRSFYHHDPLTQQFEMNLVADVNWESSTGRLSDLAGGKIIEILSYDPNVTESELEACAMTHYSAIMSSGSGRMLTCDPGMTPCVPPAPWNGIFWPKEPEINKGCTLLM